MKTNNTSPFVFKWFNVIIVAIAIVITAAIGTAKGQDYYDVINGLFTPNQSERFFQAGREDFEREVEIFNHPERYLNEDLLQINPELVDRMNQIQLFSDFDSDKAQYQLFFDAKQ